VSEDPIARFEAAIQLARQTESFDATRAALATADAQGRPSVRFVLVKGHSAEGFVFFTHYDSPKARDLEQNPHAALAFHWSTTGEQVRVRGPVHRASSQVSDDYFAGRSRGSQIGASASPQSKVVESREALEAMVERARAVAGDGPVARPEFWGGYVLVPTSIEFWTDRDDRLHDRLLFAREGQGWSVTRLAP
jgi:pyridoxamine 5'-phosphate oxidase